MVVISRLIRIEMIKFASCSMMAMCVLSAALVLTTITSFNVQAWQSSADAGTVHLRGIVMPAKKVKLSFSQPGVVEQLAAGGTMLAKGDVIGKLSDKKAKAQLAQAHAEYRSAQSQLASSQHDKDKNARLVEQQILSEIAVLEAEFTVTVAQEKVAVAKAKLDIAKAALAACTVNAPFDGAVVAVNVSKGEWAKQGEPFAELVNFTELSLSLDIPPELADGLTIGLTTSVLNNNEEVGEAQVKTIYPVIDPASGLRRIVWHVYPKSGYLLSGRYVSLASWSQVISKRTAE